MLNPFNDGLHMVELKCLPEGHLEQNLHQQQPWSHQLQKWKVSIQKASVCKGIISHETLIKYQTLPISDRREAQTCCTKFLSKLL
jgi:hypothetical protein